MAQETLQDPAEAMKLDQLRKVLALERSKGFSDGAVVGGLDGFVKRWAQEAHRAVPHPMVRSGLSRMGMLEPQYEAMAPQERAGWVERVLAWSNGLGTLPPVEAKPDATPAPSPTSRKAAPPRKAPRPSQSGPGGQFLAAGQGLETPLGQIRGFTPALLKLLERLGITIVRDLLFHFPRRHIDFTTTQPIGSLEIGKEQTAVGTVWEVKELRFARGRRGSAEAVIGDDSGNVRAIWFNGPHMARVLKRGSQVALSGRVGIFKGRKVFQNPEYEEAGNQESVHTARLVPVYPKTEGLTSRRIRGIVKGALDGASHLLAEFLPSEQRRRLGMAELPWAVREAHFPSSDEDKDRSRRRLAYDELFLIQLGVLARKRAWKEGMPGHPLRVDAPMFDAFLGSLPFTLTGAQKRVLDEVLTDLGKSIPMSRLIQGEVGSGKTVIALAAMLVAVANGQQTAFMAPTEVLAEQHFRTISTLLGGGGRPHYRGASPMLEGMPVPSEAAEIASFTLDGHTKPITVGLLTGSMPRKRKQEVQEMTARGEIDVVVGTHALIQKEAVFVNLALAIVDEQHRFGVMQRSELRQKGYNPHLLAMTATPIPRTLSLTLYGDLDISTIGELPPGRQEIRTKWLDASERGRAYGFVAREVAEGRQAFIVYPLVEESENLDVAAATEEYERLSRDIFPDLRLGLLHGRMKASEKESVMRAFRERETDVLITTAVVEVGIDIPNATVMLVEGADRFGLAQLHQFRGRVGRGEHPSYCILIAEAPSPEAGERLGVVERTHDGFVLAEEDLRLRGPGEFFGTRQSGLPDLRMARLSDVPLLELARAEATALFEQDPGLEKPEHHALAQEVARWWEHRTLLVGEA